MPRKPSAQGINQGSHRLIAEQFLIRDHVNPGADHVMAWQQAGDRLVFPQNLPFRIDRDDLSLINPGVPFQAEGTGSNFTLQGLMRRSTQHFRFRTRHLRVHFQPKSLQLSDKLIFDQHIPLWGERSHKLFLLMQTPHQHAGPAINKALCQPFMQRVGQFIFNFTGPPLPMCAIAQPAGAVGDKCPGADIGDTRRQSMDLPIGAVEPVYLPRDIVFGQHASLTHHMMKQFGKQTGMTVWAYFTEIGHLANLPQATHGIGVRAQPRNFIVSSQQFERTDITGLPRTAKPAHRRRRLQTVDQPAHAAKFKPRITPFDRPNRVESVGFHLFDQHLIQQTGLAGRAKTAVISVSPGAPRDLRNLSGPERPVLDPVEFRKARKGHMIDIHVQPHADRIGCHQKINFT